MLDNDQRPGADARGADHLGAVRSRGVRIGRTAVTGWVLAAVLVVAGFGTANGQSIDVVDTARMAELGKALREDEMGAYLAKYPQG